MISAQKGKARLLRRFFRKLLGAGAGAAGLSRRTMRFLHTADLSLDGPTWPTQNPYILIEARENIVDHGVCCLGIIDSA